MFFRKTLARIKALEERQESLYEHIRSIEDSDPMMFLTDKYYELRKEAVKLARTVIKHGKRTKTVTKFGGFAETRKTIKWKNTTIELVFYPSQFTSADHDVFQVVTDDITFKGKDAEELWYFAEQCHDRPEAD